MSLTIVDQTRNYISRLDTDCVKTLAVNGNNYTLNILDTGVTVSNPDHGAMVSGYAGVNTPDIGGFFVSMDSDLDKVMLLVSTLGYSDLRSLISNWEEVKNFLSLMKGS